MKTESPGATREKPRGSSIGRSVDSESGRDGFKGPSATGTAAETVLAVPGTDRLPQRENRRTGKKRTNLKEFVSSGRLPLE